ncbi:hypothetical protein ID866_12385, partial [Astraeus odoratus]
MEQPCGHERFGPNGEPLACCLLSSLYGIHQAAYDFHDVLSEELLGQGFSKNDVDRVVFIYQKEGTICLMAWHVNDGLAGCNNPSFLATLKHCLHLCFRISDMGLVTKYLGIQFECNLTT